MGCDAQKIGCAAADQDRSMTLLQSIRRVQFAFG
jgi:hypothetical protein